MIDIGQLRLNIFTLEAQKAGIEEQIRRLREIPCPANCENGTVRRECPDPDRPERVAISFEACDACNGTGYAYGEFPRYR